MKGAYPYLKGRQSMGEPGSEKIIPAGTRAAITLRRPDDWHVHLRDGAMLTAVAKYTARQFARAIVMPNLVPPVTTRSEERRVGKRSGPRRCAIAQRGKDLRGRSGNEMTPSAC